MTDRKPDTTQGSQRGGLSPADIVWSPVGDADRAGEISSDCGGSEEGDVAAGASPSSFAAPHSRQFDDIYFSGDGPAEAHHVFVRGNNLKEHFVSVQTFTIGELGFGTGLNFLAALDLWRRTMKPPGAQLNFFSVEKFPLSQADIEKAHRAWPDFAADAAALRAALPPAVPGFHHRRICDGVFLTLFLGDALDGLKAFDGVVDAWFLDGFSPAKNPAMWTDDIFHAVAAKSGDDASAATFTVAGAVRRGLQGAGFDIARAPGFGRKREMLTARLKSSAAPAVSAERPAWFARPATRSARSIPETPPDHVAVVGAGIAGASLASALTARGLAPVVFDPAGPAAGASGNRAGLIMPRIDLGDTPAAKFFLQSYIHAATIAARLPAGVFNPCGVLLKAQTPEDRVRFQKIAAGGLAPKDWLHCRDDGLFFQQAGIIDPKRYVDALLGDAPVIRERVISVTCGDSANTLDVKTDKGRYQDYRAIIFANSVEASRSVGGDALGLSGVAGQIDIFPDASPPDHGLAFGPYAGPAPAGGLVIGATYEKLASGAAAIVTAAATASNIKAVSEGAPDVADRLETSKAVSRASVRCQTPDRLPIVGPMPDWAFFAENYAGLTQGRRAQGRGAQGRGAKERGGAYPPARYQPGVFVLAGLGSRGLVTAPLCAEVIASLATGAALPVAADVADALHPARFCIRALKRGR